MSLEAKEETQGWEAAHDKPSHDLSTIALLAALVAVAPAAASANSLLSGYGGPGAGNQAILGSALIGGGGSAGGGGSSGSSGSSTGSSGSSAGSAGCSSCRRGGSRVGRSSGRELGSRRERVGALRGPGLGWGGRRAARARQGIRRRRSRVSSPTPG